MIPPAVSFDYSSDTRLILLPDSSMIRPALKKRGETVERRSKKKKKKKVEVEMRHRAQIGPV